MTSALDTKTFPSKCQTDTQGGCWWVWGGFPWDMSALATQFTTVWILVCICISQCAFSHTIKNIVCKHEHIPTVRIPCTKSLLSTHHFMGAQLNTLMTGDDSSTANTPVFCFQHVKPGINFFHIYKAWHQPFPHMKPGDNFFHILNTTRHELFHGMIVNREPF